MHASDTDSRSIVSRRRVLAGGATALAVGAGLLALTSDDPARAEVVMGEFSVASDSATVDGPPERIDVTASGEYEITSNTVPEMTETTLQVHIGSEGELVDDLDTQTAFDTAAGTFDLSADLLADHSEVDASDFMPAERGTTKTTDLLIRVVCTAVSGGSILAEDHVQDTTTVTLDYEGVVVDVGGAGAVEVITG